MTIPSTLVTVGVPHVQITASSDVLWRVNPDGSTQPVRTMVHTPPSTWTFYDYELQQGVAVTYTNGVDSTVSRTMPAVGVWLIHLTDPAATSVKVTIADQDDWSLPASAEVVDVPGRGSVRVSFGDRLSRRGPVKFYTSSAAEEDDLVEILRDQSVLFMSAPSHFTRGYVALGDVTWSRNISYGPDPLRFASTQYVVLERPAVVAGMLGQTINQLTGVIDALPGSLATLGTV